MRLHDRLLELPYLLFVERFCGTGAGAGRGGGEGPTGGVRHASPSGGGGGFGASGAWGGPQSTSDEAASDVPYHRIAYFKHGGALVWESEYHKRRISDLPCAAPGAAPSDGGGSSAAADRSRRRNSRDGMLPPPAPAAQPPLPGQTAPAPHGLPHGLPPPSPQHSWLGASAPSPQYSWLGGGGGYTPPPRARALGGGGRRASNGAASRSPRGASPTASDDGGLDGGSSDDGGGEELLLLLEEDEEEDAEGEGEEEGDEEEGAEAQWVGAGAAAFARGAEAALPAVPQLPEECWMAMLRQLGVREVCMVGRTCRWLRQLASDPAVWRAQFQALWGTAPEPQLAAAVVRRMCRRSQLRAARWVEAAVRPAAMGFPSTTCLQLDDSKVVSADGNAVRLWSHALGRRIATLQGHPGRVTALAFDEALLVSGCAGAVVKLWSMDELRCKRTLRGHEGAVAACCLLPTGIPVSGGEDGLMRLWDVASGTAIVALEAGGAVHAVQAHAQSGHLVAAAGSGVQLWDVSTATLLQTLGAGGVYDTPAAAAQQQQHHPYTCVSYVGELLAAGRQGEVVLMDPRVAAPVGRLYGRAGGGADGTAPAGGGGGGGMGAIAAAAAAAAAGGGGARCVGVQMDEWKLVTGFNDGRHQLHVYDTRSLARHTAGGGGGGGGGAARPWAVPLMTLAAPARINTFQFHEQALLAGLEGAECVMWRFENPGGMAAVPGGAPVAAIAAAAGGGPRSAGGGTAGGGGYAAGGAGSGSPGPEGGFADGSGRKEKKKPSKAKVAKKQGRYPKRNTK